jgi:cathepsin B
MTEFLQIPGGKAAPKAAKLKAPKIQRAFGHLKEDGGMDETMVDLSSGWVPWKYNSHTAYPNCISAVQDQGVCGSCYAFATASALSERQCIYMSDSAETAGVPAPPGVNELSQQAQISCGSQISIQDDPACGHNFTHACDGGNGGMALQYIASYGLDRAAAYPYASGGGSAADHFDVVGEYVPNCDSDTAIAEKADNVYVYSIGKSSNEAQIKAAILAEGPVYVGFTVYGDIWDMDPMRVYTPNMNAGIQGGHAVMAYGWGIDRGVKYWHLRNSWGSEWGDGGDFRMRRGLGLIDSAYWGSVDPATPYPIDTSGVLPECVIASGYWFANVDPGLFQVADSCYFAGTNNCEVEIKLWGSQWGLSCYQSYKIPVGRRVLFQAPCDLELRATTTPLSPAFTGPLVTFATQDIAGTDHHYHGPTDAPTYEPTEEPSRAPTLPTPVPPSPPPPTSAPTPEPTQYPSASPTYMGGCTIQYLGDGFCDRENNVHECDYDGGDCCRSTCEGAVYTCGDDNFGFSQCIDPLATDHTDCEDDPQGVVAGLGMTCDTLETEQNVGCDFDYHSIDTNYAVGTFVHLFCPLTCGTCVASGTNSGGEFDRSPTPPPTQKPTVRSCVRWWQGDGHCDPVNNVKQCLWDGGDCCESSCNENTRRGRSHTFSCGEGRGYNCLDPAAGFVGVVEEKESPPAAQEVATVMQNMEEKKTMPKAKSAMKQTKAAPMNKAVLQKKSKAAALSETEAEAQTLSQAIGAGNGQGTAQIHPQAQATTSNLKGSASTVASKLKQQGGGSTTVLMQDEHITVINARFVQGRTLLNRILDGHGAAFTPSSLMGAVALVSAVAVLAVGAKTMRRQRSGYRSAHVI